MSATDKMTTTTTETLQGMRIVEYKGVVKGTAAHRIDAGDYKAWGSNMLAGRAGGYEHELDRGESEAMAEIKAAATEIGANAIIDISLDCVPLHDNMVVVSVTGTAAVVAAA